MMTQDADLQHLEQKTYRESQQDGLAELLLGVLLMLLSLMLRRPPFVAFLGLWMLYVPGLLERLRERHTYPRIGVARPHAEDAKELARGIFGYMTIVALVMAIGLFIFMGRSSAWNAGLLYQWAPAWFGMMLVGAMTYLHSRSGDPRCYVYAIVAILLGITFSLIPFEGKRIGVSLYCLTMGVGTAIAGFITFRLFLRRNPLPAGGVADGED